MRTTFRTACRDRQRVHCYEAAWQVALYDASEAVTWTTDGRTIVVLPAARRNSPLQSLAPFGPSNACAHPAIRMSAWLRSTQIGC